MKHEFSLSKYAINIPNIMKKFKYQQYFHCFIVCTPVSYAFWFSYQQNMVTILISPAFRGAALIKGYALIRGRRLFQCGYSERQCLLKSGAYLRPDAYQRKCGITFFQGHCAMMTLDTRTELMLTIIIYDSSFM